MGFVLMSLGEKLRSLRESKGLTMKELSEKLGVDRTSVSAWERDRTTPNYDMLIKICSVLSCDFRELASR